MNFLKGLVLIAIIYWLYTRYKSKNRPNNKQNKYNKVKDCYERKDILPKNEYYFYKKLRPIAKKCKCDVLCKVRLADIIKVKSNIERKITFGLFQRIKSRHIDFTFIDPETAEILLLLELDDSSHYSLKQQQRDDFIDTVCIACGYKIIHLEANDDIEQIIYNKLIQDTNEITIQKNLDD